MVSAHRDAISPYNKQTVDVMIKHETEAQKNHHNPLHGITTRSDAAMWPLRLSLIQKKNTTLLEAAWTSRTAALDSGGGGRTCLTMRDAHFHYQPSCATLAADLQREKGPVFPHPTEDFI